MSRRRTEDDPHDEPAVEEDLSDESPLAAGETGPEVPDFDRTLGLLGPLRTLLAELQRRRNGGSDVKSNT